MTATTIVLGSTVLAALFGAIVTGLFSKRKLSAEATKIITDAASGVVERLERENSRVIETNAKLSERLTAAEQSVESLKKEDRLRGEQLAVHASWDRQVVVALGEVGIALPTPPPLYPEAIGGRP